MIAKERKVKALIFSVVFLGIAFALPVVCNVGHPNNFKNNQLYSRSLDTPALSYVGEMTS